MRRQYTPSPYGVELERLRTRADHFLSRDQLAERTKKDKDGNPGVTADQIYNLETGRSKVPHFDTHRLMADALDLDAEERKAFDDLFHALDNKYNRRHGLIPQLPADEIDRAVRLTLSAIIIASALVALIRQVLPLVAPPSVAISPRLPALTVAGALVDASPASGGRSVLLAMNLHTQGMAQLLPDPSDPPGQADTWIAPAYAPAQNELAAIRIDPKGVRSLWEASLRFTADGRLSIVPGSLRELVADCGNCGTLAFSTSGHQVIYETANGLQAINPMTRAMRQVTSGADDAWPACSPNGRWIAYQHDVNHAQQQMLAPSGDCMPTGPAVPVGGYSITWHPAFSPDSGLLAFNGTPGGNDQAHHRVFLISLTTLETKHDAHDALALPAASAVSDSGCADPAWVTQHSEPHILLIYACGTHLIAEPGTRNPSWRQQMGNTSDLAPQLYNPTWIPPTAKSAP